MIVCLVCYLSECSQIHTHGSCLCRDKYELLLHQFSFGFFSERGKSDRSQDCPLNFLPLRQIDRDHADHPSCWLCVLSRPVPTVQTMSEVNPSTEVERTRCSNCICQVRSCENVMFRFCMILNLFNTFLYLYDDSMLFIQYVLGITFYMTSKCGRVLSC